ncbi:MAG TPA: GH116 family glycosyl hydrolase, partial [Candidatus Hydrogenedentes bacterium]|nr:GH116 family glycosyl hydrolase [Candidatus Hydrogenedentota bacterium]
NPFIPGNPDDSGFPAAILKYTLQNRRRNPVDVTIAWSVLNPVGGLGKAAASDPVLGGVAQGYGGNVNRYIEAAGLRGLEFASEKWPETHPRYGSVALLTPEKNVTVMRYWSRKGWFTPYHELWDAFSTTGRLPDHEYDPTEDGQTAAGALGIRVRLQPRAAKTVTFYITWYFPNFEKYWHDAACVSEALRSGCCAPKRELPTWKNYYATRFSSAVDVAAQLHAREKTLHAATKRFHDALFSSTLPPYVIDAVSSQAAILKTATCLRLTDGTFYGFEGSAPVGGCCEGSCTHVWNYQQALAFLFPSLERSMRLADYKHNLRPDGSMGFRLNLPIGAPPNDFLPCADGQLGGIIKAYRDWKISGDDAYVRQLWPSLKRALEYAWREWDPDRTGVLRGRQHNTYDIEFYGENTMTSCFYLGALLAGAEIAAHLGDDEAARAYREVYGRGSAWIDTELFNGEYYEQHYDPEDAPEYQYGKGCLADQVLGVWLAEVAGLGPVIDAEHARKALRAIFRHNWRADLREHANAQRVYALHDEAGLLNCTWPQAGRPAVPFPYSDEVWTGIEYQVASHCILAGLVEEGLTIVRAARDRYDGHKRNPWDEFECGHHYARAMASYGLLLAISGFRYDKGAGVIGFAPRIHTGSDESDGSPAGDIGFAPCVRARDFRCFWALDGAWGVYHQRAGGATLTVLSGELPLSRLDLPHLAGAKSVALAYGRRRFKAAVDEYGSITLPTTLHLVAGRPLAVKVRK